LFTHMCGFDLCPRGELEHLTLKEGDFPEPIWLCQAEFDAHVAIGEVAGGADASAPIASAPRQHHDVGCIPTLAKHFEGQQREVAPGVLHHLKERLILDSRVVDVRIVYTDAIPCLKP